MVSHLNLPYHWVECTQNPCQTVVHFDAPADELNETPKEWVMALTGVLWKTSAYSHTGSDHRNVLETVTFFNEKRKKHNLNGPAKETHLKTFFPSSIIRRAEWWVNGERHREDGPALVISNGVKVWYFHDKKHRTDGPAVIREDGSREWWINDQRHRSDGPAIENSDGTQEWYVDGKRLGRPLEMVW